MTWRAAALLGVLLLSSSARAQAGVRVILLAPEAAREAWTGSLRIELAAEGGDVLVGEPPAGRSARERALDARERAERADVDAAVWVEPGHRDLLHVHVLATESGRTLAAPLSSAPDGRTLALVAVSLLDEALALPEAPISPIERAWSRPASMLGDPAGRLAGPIMEVRAAGHAPAQVTLGEPAEPWLGLYAGLGAGGMAFASDVSFDPGAIARVVLGMRLGDVLRLQANIEGGVFSERFGLEGGGLELQPFGRLCPEVAAAIPLGGGLAFWVGAHTCAGVAEARRPIFESVFDPPPGPTSDDYEDGLVMTAAAGGFLALDVPLSRSLALWIRGDLDGHTMVDVNRNPDVLFSLTTAVVFR